MQSNYPIIHMIKQGDNLFNLSQTYQTTVRQILAQNPTIDPYNLPIGDNLIIYPGEYFSPQQVACQDPTKQIALINKMRLLWSQHVYWTRMAIISIAEQRSDQDATVGRLLQNPGDLANLFGEYYNASIAASIEKLITEHLQIAAALVTALRDGKTTEANTLNQQWYANADQMADAFASINPYYNRDEVRRMFYRHLDLTKQEAAMRLAKNYPADINVFSTVEQEILDMADMFTRGLIRQFPQSF